MKQNHEKTNFAIDDNGERYVCYFEDEEEHTHHFEELDEEEKSHCKQIEFPWN